MDSATIRTEVREQAFSANAIWPNGLGFNWRGWEYSYGNRGWSASRDDWLGFGETPRDAKANAYQQPPAEGGA